MCIKKIKIKDFKCFKGIFEVELDRGLNIIVGNNSSGKSTILEAIHLALTGIFLGRNIQYEVSQNLFNKTTVDEYLKNVKSEGMGYELPSIVIEIYFDDSIDAEFQGNSNLSSDDARGIQFKVEYDNSYNDEYLELVRNKNIKSLPIEYYTVSWQTFARQTITTRKVPIKSAVIDSSNYRYQNGSDLYISKIIKNTFSPEDIVLVSQEHRRMKEEFMESKVIKEINQKLNQDLECQHGKVSLTVDLGAKNAWEGSLVTQVDDISFGFIGKGLQCILKTELALQNRNSEKAGVLLLEEPESHLSYSKLSQLIHIIQKNCEHKQVIISTHSSFVANKLGLRKLLLLNNQNIIRFKDLKPETEAFFEKIDGYDTLRMLLSQKVILVEGASDELIIQKAYMQRYGRLPIEDQIDVISVGTSFLRFLEIAEKLGVQTRVVTDNDGSLQKLEKKYENYIGENKKPNITIYYDKNVHQDSLNTENESYNSNTLEPNLIRANGDDISLFNDLFGSCCQTLEELKVHMRNNKTDCALAIFKSDKEISFPSYIEKAIEW